jgi:hypothetical protein
LGIFNRLPRREQVAPVYAVIVLFIYGWTTWWFCWNVPGWINFMRLGEILVVYAYALTTNFFESLTVLLGILCLCLILPRKLFLDLFVARGIALAALGLGYMMYLSSLFVTKETYPSGLLRWSPAIALLLAGGAYFVGNGPALRKGLESFGDRAIIFLYLSIPASMISLLVVIFRMVG